MTAFARLDRLSGAYITHFFDLVIRASRAMVVQSVQPPQSPFNFSKEGWINVCRGEFLASDFCYCDPATLHLPSLVPGANKNRFGEWHVTGILAVHAVDVKAEHLSTLDGVPPLVGAIEDGAIEDEYDISGGLKPAGASLVVGDVRAQPASVNASSKPGDRFPK